MRFTLMLGSLALGLLSANSLLAMDTPPDVRTIVVPQAQVWCGPSTSDGLYPTNVLRQGDRVQVEHELESGWLAIRPPTGSFSWINNRFVKHIVEKYTTYVVSHEDYPVPVFIGSSLKTDRPNKYGVKLSRGTQVRVIGKAITDEEGMWLPIEPPEGEVRYLRRESVAKPGSPPATTIVASSSSAKPAAPPPPDGDTLWRDAEKAERTGRTADAIRLYRLTGDANLSVNPSRADEAYRRAHWLEQAQNGRSPGGSYYYPDRDARATQAASSGVPYSLPTYQGGNNAFQTIGSAASGAPNGQLVSTQGVNQLGEAHYRGRLELAFNSRSDAMRRYRLYDNSGKNILLWVVAGSGVELSNYDGRAVEVWGYTSWNHDLRHWLLTVSHVQEQP